MKKITLSLVAMMTIGSNVLTAESYPADGPNSYKALHSGNGTSTRYSANNKGFYLGLAYSFMRNNSEFQISNGGGASGDIDGNLATIISGFNFHDNIALEVRYNTLVGDVSTAFGSYSTNYSNIAFFLKPKIEVEQTTVYALLGYGQSKFSSFTDEDFQWGFGASYPLNRQTDMFIDYTNTYNKEQTIGNIYGKDNVHLFTFGINIHFPNAI